MHARRHTYTCTHADAHNTLSHTHARTQTHTHARRHTHLDAPQIAQHKPAVFGEPEVLRLEVAVEVPVLEQVGKPPHHLTNDDEQRRTTKKRKKKTKKKTKEEKEDEQEQQEQQEGIAS
jgi:hypothetical protein